MRTCECQAKNPDDAVYCAYCGRRLPAMESPHVATAPIHSTETVTAKAARQRRVMVIAAGFVVVILVVAVGLTFALRNVHIDITSNSLVSVQLPLNVCPTSVGDTSATSTSLPSTVRVEINKVDSSKLAFYSDNEGLTTLLAPSGWTCTSTIGANGSSSVQVSPSGQTVAASGALGAGSTAQVISASQTSACVGCRESIACPLFDSAANDYQRAFQKACPTTRPSSEVESMHTGNLAEFTDPPGVNGDATPSGGEYPAMGVMTYFDDVKSDGSWTETCVLPATDKSLCKVILGNFVARYAKR